MFLLVARFISLVFHPLFLTSYIFAFLFYATPHLLATINEKIANFLMQGIVILTLMFPMVFIFLLKRLQIIASLQLPDRKERFIPFLGTTFMYASTTYMATYIGGKLGIDPKISYILFSITISLTLLILGTLFFKISAHCVAIGGTFGGMLALGLKTNDTALVLPLAVACLLMGLVATARLALNAHTQREVWAGLVIGISTNFGVMYLLM